MHGASTNADARAAAPVYDAPTVLPAASDGDDWFYVDAQGSQQGPFSGAMILDWFYKEYFDMNLLLAQAPLRSSQQSWTTDHPLAFKILRVQWDQLVQSSSAAAILATTAATITPALPAAAAASPAAGPLPRRPRCRRACY